MLATNTSHHAPVIDRGRSLPPISISCVLLLAITCTFFILPVAAKAKGQLFLAPVAIFLISRIRFLGIAAPPFVLALAMVGAVSGFAWQFYHVSLATGAFVVSTATDQELRQESKIYRDRLRKSIGPDGRSLVGLYSYTVKDEAGARRIIDVGGKVAGVIWGSPQWIRVALRSYEPIALSDFPDGSLARRIIKNGGWPDLFISRTVRNFELSDGYARSTVFFIAQIAKIWGAIPEITKINGYSDEYEARMESLGRIQARWSSRAHLAVPLWLAGTMNLVRALEGMNDPIVELDCAVRNFRAASNSVTPRDNPILDMSIKNNLSIALLAKAELGIDPEMSRNSAVRYLRAANVWRYAEPVMGASVAQNLYAVLPQLTKKRR